MKFPNYSKMVLFIVVVFAVSGIAGCSNQPGNSKPGTKAEAGSSVAPAPQMENPGDLLTTQTFKMNGATLRFSAEKGILESIENNSMKLEMEGLMVDTGVGGKYCLNLLGYKKFDGLATWELPSIFPRGTAQPTEWELLKLAESSTGIESEIKAGSLKIKTTYSMDGPDLKIRALITNTDSADAIINGVAFVLRGVRVNTDARFDFPGNVPHNIYSISKLSNNYTVQTGLVNPVIRNVSGKDNFNVVFIDQEEKWGTGVYKDKNSCLNYINLAAVESRLKPGETLECGDMYIQMPGSGDAFKPIRDLYERNGWTPPQDGVTDGPLYSCHPYGTMDSDFPLRQTMAEYAKELNGLADMGIKNVWVLPIFDHADRGVYSPTDQSIIDKRYGGDVAVRTYVDKAHSLGMNVMFDYVPHGPEPDDLLALDNKQWCSVDKEGQQQIEWDCVSFDMANPDYQKYTYHLVMDHIKRFGLDGGRVDCSMGGLPNWNPYPGNRPSNSNLKGGVDIARTIRQAFVDSGKKPVILPENFNPVPLYYPYTDLFYDMGLYRVLVELGESSKSEKEFATELARWLSEEHSSSPEGQQKLRFLGNHDTVSWVWQQARATKIYGVEKSKAMWALFSFIDGVPMIYQGDEDGSIYKGDGPDLRAFFKDIFGAREKFLGSRYDIEYLMNDSPVVAFKRFLGDDKKLVAVNLSGEDQIMKIDGKLGEILYGEGSIKDGSIELKGYSYMIVGYGG